jgi:hypothetical protein
MREYIDIVNYVINHKKALNISCDYPFKLLLYSKISLRIK